MEILDKLNIKTDNINLYELYNNLNIGEANRIINNIDLNNSSTVLLVPFRK